VGVPPRIPSSPRQETGPPKHSRLTGDPRRCFLLRLEERLPLEAPALCLAVMYMFLAFIYEEVRVVGALIRWLFRLLLFRVLVGLWRIVRRR
jgi:hypothetical protein